MSKYVKCIIVGAITTIIGAILLECGLRMVGGTVFFLGFFAIIFGPLALDL